MSEAALVCEPSRPGRGAALIGSMPLLMAGLVLGRQAISELVFHEPAVLSVELVGFSVALLSALWLIPAYWMATAMLSTVRISDAGVTREGVPGARLFIPWSAVTRLQLTRSTQGADAVIISGPGGRVTLAADSHTHGAAALARVEAIARARGLAIEQTHAARALVD